MEKTATPEELIVMEAYALVGHVATGFAALEFHLQFLVTFLITGEQLSPVAVLVTRKHQFAEKLDILKDLVTMRFPAGSDLRKESLDFIAELNALREKRNLHIHGFWLINYPLLASEKLVRVSDPRWRFDKKTETWQSMQSMDVSLKALEEQSAQIAKLIEKTHELISKALSHPTLGKPNSPSETA